MHSNETWHASQCLEQEEAAVGAICTHLSELGYRTTTKISHTRSIWQRGLQTMVVSLVDDAWDCATDRGLDTPYLFDAATTVITDNWINTPTVYQVARLPDSFYGIYSYTPADQTWQPVRDYTFSVNRLQFLRMRILAQLHQNLGIDHGHVNFNCDAGPNVNVKQAFCDQLIYATEQEVPVFRLLADMMPLKNYNFGHEQAYTHSWLNIVVETYSSDNVIALSEKIFRCLVTPVPWIVYSGRYTIARLRSLDFDVLDDVIDHDYDSRMEANNKMAQFIDCAKVSINTVKQHNWHGIQQRCLAAAQHNQQRLAQMKAEWPHEFASWLDQRIL